MISPWAWWAERKKVLDDAEAAMRLELARNTRHLARSREVIQEVKAATSAVTPGGI